MYGNKLFLSFILFCLPHFLSAQYKYNFQVPSIRLTADDGLPNHYFRGIVQDSYGFIWVGSYDGVSRLDGSTIKVFKNNPADSTTLSNNNVSSIINDPIGKKIWIGTKSGVNVYDPVNDRFEVFLNNVYDSTSIPGNHIQSLLVDKDGEVWIGNRTVPAISRFDRTSGRFDNYYLKEVPEEEERGGALAPVNAMVQDPKNDSLIWIGTPVALLSFNKVNKNIARNTQVLGHVEHIYAHSDGFLYVEIEDKKIVKFDPVEKKAVSQILFDSDWQIRMLHPKSAGELWVSANNGLAILDVNGMTVTQQWHNHTNGVDYYDVDYIDPDQRIWSGTIKGLRVYDPMATQVSNYFYERKHPNGPYISDQLIEDPDGNKIYFNVQNGDGFYIFDKTTENWEIIPPYEDYPRRYFSGKGMARRENGELIIFDAHDAYTLSKDRKTLVPYRGKADLSDKGGWANMTIDSRGYLWAAGKERGIIRVNLLTGAIEDFSKDVPLCFASRYYFHQDSQENVWITGCKGFAVYSYKNGTLQAFAFDSGDPQLESLYKVFDFAEDRNGNIWLSDRKGKLCLIDVDDPGLGIQKIIPLRDLILKDSVRILKGTNVDIGGFSFMQVDNDGFFWILTDLGLMKLNPENLDVEIYTQEDGFEVRDRDMKVNTLNRITKLSSGEMVVGFKGGIGFFDPQEMKQNDIVPQAYLCGFKVFQEEQSLDTSLFFIKEIHLDHDENFFSFDFSAINFTNPIQTKIKYQLEGIDEDWIAADGRNFAGYTNIDGGNYTFKVMAANNDGVWESGYRSVQVKVKIPWWKSNWFYAVFTMLLLGSVYAVYRYRIAQVTKREQQRSAFLEKLANVEMSALRAQMNPHFIFNCLNSIDHYIIKNETRKASEYLNSFSRLIRLILQNSRSNYVNLKDELEALKLYIEMESLRFDDRFHYEFHISKGLHADMIEIPPMLLQPYVENAIWHGLMHKQGKGTIALEVKKENGKLLCVIEDDGIGRAKAQRIKSNKRTKKKSMGMQITEDRIRMINKLYNSNTTVEVIDLENEIGEPSGTRVELNIPI